MRATYDGNGRQHCTYNGRCGYRSIAGLVKGQGHCPFHWVVRMWGLKWARGCFPDWTPKERA